VELVGGRTNHDNGEKDKCEDDEEYDDDEEEVEDNIDRLSQFNFNLLASFAFLLLLTHIWWIIDVILWCFGFYSTGINGVWSGNPLRQCSLKSW